MTSLARTKKSLLTRRLNSIAEWLEDSERLLIPPGETEKPNRIKDLRVALRVCEENIATIESSLHGLGEAFENISERSAEDDEKFDKYVESANDMIIKLVSHKAKLLRIWEDCMDTTDQETVGERRPATQSPLSASKLPEIPIPNFSGKRWEWDNYWALFLANVHEQDLTDLQKFNYLLSSLSGEAKQSISRFQVSAADYSKALDHLKNRYGHKDGIILELHRNLDYCTARGPRTEDQRQLFEKLSAIAAQLKDHGEHLDNYLAVHTFLHKFHGRIQKAATKRCMRHEAPFSHQGSEPTHQESDNDWTLELWLSTIDSLISEEERLQDMLPRNKEKDAFHMPQNRGFSVTACECCKLKGHKWSTCPKIPTPTSRRAFLLESNRCLNCGSNTHRVASCTGGNCRKCHQKHHTAICTKSNGQATNAANLEKRNVPRMVQQQQPAKPSPTHSAKSKLSRPSKQHVVTVENQPLTQKIEDVDDAVVLQVNKRSDDLRNKVILLVGSTEILDAKNMTRKATVLLDTGSELSFIREDFAQELGLPVVDRTSLMISTFGTEDSVARQCDVSTLQIRDVEGCHHELRLFRSEYITGTIEQADLNQEDWDFINQHKVVLSLQKRSPALQPEILLGCDYLWNFMMPMGKLTLPSGLQLIPTKFEYIISGLQSQKTRSSVKTLTILNPQREKDVWDPPQLHEQWRIITCGIATFYKEIGRKVVNDDGPYTMFVFADASHFAMATCVYLGGESAPNLVMAKSKLASIKTAITVPKLEMNAITLGARVAHFVYSSMSGLIEIQRVLFFTDSEIVLGWMKASANRQAMGVLVANRLKEVRRIVDNLEAQGVTVLFGHIPTALNPADCATRGLTSASCQEHFWWNGPQFIHGDITKTSEYEKMFPLVKSQEEAVGDIDAQMAAMTLITLQRNEMEEPTVFRLARFSSLYKAKRVVAYVHRFIHRLLQHFPLARKEAIFEAIPALRSRHEFTDKELREAKNTIIRDHQKALVDSHRISSQKELNIQPDQQGILHCYGRLDRAAIPTMPFLLTIIFFSSLIGTSTANDFNNTHHLQCTEGGVVVSQKTRHQFEICSEDYCLTYKHPRNEEVILFPPHIVLHEHVVKWKIFDGNDVDVLETICAAAPFCTQIDCTFCVAIIANPECWPRTAIVLTGLLIYVLIALCYFLFHVPVIIGHPILYTFRIFGRIGVVTIMATVIFLVKTVPSTVLRMLRGIRRNRRRRLWSEISILLTISCTFAKGCQEVNIFDHQLQSCRHTKGGETCTVDTLEIVKINPFKQEACLRLTNNRTNVLEVKLLWKSLDLICEKETMMFTRSTRYGLLDSKRCPHTGSCIGQKCGAVHRHSRIAELDRANQYAGVTGCVESCGGPGCDCFYLSSGCLFYRIYLIPNDDSVYEIFRCTRWKQTVQLQMTVNKAQALMKVHNFRISPNQPRILSPTTITLSSITVPPTPLLNSAFVADRKRTALAPHGYVPPLRCGSREKAENMTCDIVEDCHCHPAEIKMLCDCKDFNLTAHMLNPEYQLPILRPNVEFRMKQNLIARIPQLPTAEFILRIKDEFRTTLVTSDAICTAKSTQCTGCYNCGKGARAEIICTSSTPEARAEIQCDDYGFVVPCTSQGAPSELHFFSNRAQFYANCSIQCGTVRHSFEIVGILRYTGILHAALQRLLDGESEVHSEINFPDIGHIIDVFLRWSGTLLITIVIVLLALLVSYLFITNGACLCIPRLLLRFMILINRLFFRILRTLVCSPLRLLCYLYRDRKRKLRGKLP
ncbi:hypothetical protein GCK32_016887 [Trichostrongylus colubriformis]|uniref:Phlebovirus glycoprotein G2 fusion domain-containing protein n=1 Tax=Trichostrongylus colubriformis TaxID=6319 RepID=A0AAN8FG68_TRICO